MRNTLLGFFLLLSINTFAQTKNFIDQHFIEVEGMAEKEPK